MGLVNLPKTSQTGTNEWADVEDNDQALAAAINGNIEDANLASPPHGLYKRIHGVSGSLNSDTAAGTYLFDNSGVMDASPLSAGPGTTVPLFYFDDADYTVANKTLKLRLRFQVAVNATALSSVTLTAGLYPVTVAGGADTLTYTAGTVVSGSTVALANPTASTITQGNSGDFAFPTDGTYMLAVVTSATLTNNSAVSCHAQLQYRNT